MDADLLALLWCPVDHGNLRPAGEAVTCDSCGAAYPVLDAVVSLLRPEDLPEVDRREQHSRDEETTWYDTMFGGYTDAVELPSTVSRIGRPDGPILDLAAGSGRITEDLLRLGPPVIALDYSLEMLRKLTSRCGTDRVLAVHADGRSLPIRDGVLHATTFAEGYSHFRAQDRSRVLGELSRVMRPGAPLSLSALNYNLMYRVWRLLGNAGAREGEHMLGGDFYYRRMSRADLRQEVGRWFSVEEIAGMRNVPARSLSRYVARVASDQTGDRFLEWMTRKGYRIDLAIEKTPLSWLLGFFWIVRAVKRA